MALAGQCLHGHQVHLPCRVTSGRAGRRWASGARWAVPAWASPAPDVLIQVKARRSLVGKWRSLGSACMGIKCTCRAESHQGAQVAGGRVALAGQCLHGHHVHLMC